MPWVDRVRVRVELGLQGLGLPWLKHRQGVKDHLLPSISITTRSSGQFQSMDNRACWNAWRFTAGSVGSASNWQWSKSGTGSVWGWITSRSSPMTLRSRRSNII